jgi:predicted permease
MNKLLRRFSALLHRRQLRRELEEEMAAHREMMPADRRRNFGSTLRLHEQSADHWGWTWLDHLQQDLAYAARQLRRAPGFTFTAIAVLSLGIGVNLAEVHIFNAYLHHLNVRDAASLCEFQRISRRGASGAVSLPEIEFYSRHNSALSAVLTETRVDGLYYQQDSRDVRAILVSGNYFGELGIAPFYGRLLDEQDDRPGAPPVAVLGYDYWRARFGGDPEVVLRTIRLNDKPVQVVGVAPPQFGGIGWQAEVWMAPSQFGFLTSQTLDAFSVRRTNLFGRLKPGVSIDAAQAQFRSLTAELRRQQPESLDADEWLQVKPAEDRSLVSSRAGLLLSTCITLVLLVLFSACANLGNMLLARGLARRREIDIRLAVGAGRGRLVRQLMTENLLLAALASIAALFMGRLAATLLLRLTGAPSNMRIVTDWRMVLAAAALALAATLAFGLAPALQMVRGASRPTRTRRVLVSIQVTASCVLLILSSYFVRSIQQAFRTDVTFDHSGLALVDPALHERRYTPSQSRQAAFDIAARLRQVPGIEAAAIATVPPLRRSRLDHVGGQQLYLNDVDPSFFALMRLPLLAGRFFGPGEPATVVVSQSAARRLWPNQSPLGKTIRIAQTDRTVAGVVKDSGANLMLFPDSIEVYLPLSDKYADWACILVRTAGKPAPLTPSLRSASTIPGIRPMVFTLEGILNERLDSLRKMVQVIGSLAAIASLLALIGIFGLLAFTVAQRTREIGVRMALGARDADVLRIVLGGYALPVGIGAAFGVAFAVASVQVMRNLLFGSAAFDLASVAGGLLLFAAVALAASIAPVRRALRIDPASALRYE